MYIKKAIKVATELNGKQLLINNPVVLNFFDDFFKNNYMNRRVVPLDWKNKQGIFPYHVTIIPSKIKDKADEVILKGMNSDGIFVVVSPKGNKEFLNEYSSDGISIIKKNNKIRKPKTTQGKKQAAKPSYFKDQLAIIKKKIKEKSKKCKP